MNDKSVNEFYKKMEPILVDLVLYLSKTQLSPADISFILSHLLMSLLTVTNVDIDAFCLDFKKLGEVYKEANDYTKVTAPIFGNLPIAKA